MRVQRRFALLMAKYGLTKQNKKNYPRIPLDVPFTWNDMCLYMTVSNHRFVERMLIMRVDGYQLTAYAEPEVGVFMRDIVPTWTGREDADISTRAYHRTGTKKRQKYSMEEFWAEAERLLRCILSLRPKACERCQNKQPQYPEVPHCIKCAHAARKIQRAFRKAISDPEYAMCRARLMREFEEF